MKPPKNKIRPDIPLAPTPNFKQEDDRLGTKRTLTKKEYKEEKKQARWKSNIEASRAGTLVDKRIDRAAKISSAIGEAISTATGVTALAGAIRSNKRRNR